MLSLPPGARPLRQLVPALRGREAGAPLHTQVHCTPRNHQGTIPADKMRRNAKFAALWCVFLTKIKVDPESWCKKLSIKQLRVKKIPKDNFT